jgi:hypothetical protein
LENTSIWQSSFSTTCGTVWHRQISTVIKLRTASWVAATRWSGNCRT